MDNCTTVKNSDMFISGAPPELCERRQEIIVDMRKVGNSNTFSLGKKEFSRWQTLSLKTQTTVKSKKTTIKASK